MKQFIRIGLLTGLIVAAIPLWAQVAPRDSDARKGGSRLELGRSATSRKASLPAKAGRFTLIPSLLSMGLDQPGALLKNRPLNEYYRSLLMTPARSRTATGPVAAIRPAESPAVAMAEARLSAEPALDAGDLLFASDRVRVSNIYPNPASEAAQVDYQISGPVGEVKMVLLNVLGARVGEYALESGDHKLRIPTGDMSTGYYLYQLSVDGKKVATKRLLVRHQ